MTRYAEAPMFPMRTVVIGTFLPTILFEIGVGAILPIIAASATRLGASIGVAGLLVTLMPIGQILWDIPAGAMAARFGDRAAMIFSGIVAICGFLLAAFAPNLVYLGVAVVLVGIAASGYFLARQSYLTEITPPLRRARVLSTLAGIHRIGLFIGPFVGAGLLVAGTVQWVYWMAAFVTALSVLVIVLVGPDPNARQDPTSGAPVIPMMSVLRTHWRPLATLGVAVFLIGAVRGARTTVLPLWSEHVGMDPAQTSLIFGIASAVDMLLFYPAGKVMDRMGRLWVGIPSMLVMGVGLAMLPFAWSIVPLSIAAILLGLGNGMSSGILMTIGADVAPPEGRAQFLGLWRVLSDAGGALGPVVLTIAATLGSMAAGIWAMAASSVGSVAAQSVWVPRYSVHANRTTRRRAGLL